MNKEPERTQRKKHLGEVVHHQLGPESPTEITSSEKESFFKRVLRKLRKD